MILSVMIDTREPEWVQNLTFGGVPTATIELDAGDVWAATEDATLVIERKTPSDFLHSLRDKRLFNQCAKMQEHSPWSYVMVTGEMQRGANGKVWVGRRQTGWDWASIQGALLDIQEMGIFVVFCGGDEDFEAAVVRLANRHRGTKYIEPVRTSHVLSPGEACLAALPGVGMERIGALLEYTGIPALSLVALTSSDSKIPGVGPGTKAKVRAALGLPSDGQMAITVEEA